MTTVAVHGARIFVVDDQEANVRLLERLLDAAGFGNVRTFRSGSALVEALAGDEPDLVLLDLHMPPPDGFAILKILQSRTAPDDYRPVLVLTADAERSARSRALAGGAMDFLVKPFDAEEVILRVSNLLQTRLLNRALQSRNVDLAGEVTALRALEISERRRIAQLRQRIRAIIATGAFTPVFQPIVRLDDGQCVGHEALTRFTDGMPPDRQFAAAAAAGVGLGLDLEMACLAASIRAAAALPGRGWLSLNVSPELVLARKRLSALLRNASRPVIVEITEHAPIADYEAIRTALGSFGAGVRWAVDDAGAGYASFRHTLELRPAFVKLDMGLVRSIDRDPARQALAAGMVYFARTTGCQLIAEGVETNAEVETLRRLGVGLGQGYLIGLPAAAVVPGPTNRTRRLRNAAVVEGAEPPADRTVRPIGERSARSAAIRVTPTG